MGAILTKCYIFKVYNHMTYEFLNEISGGDRDEIIDFQRVESRDLWYFFQTEFMGRSWWNDRFSNHVTFDTPNGIYQS